MDYIKYLEDIPKQYTQINTNLIVELVSQIPIQKLTNKMPILFYLIYKMSIKNKTDFIRSLKTKPEQVIFHKFFLNYNTMNRPSFIQFINNYGDKLTYFIYNETNYKQLIQNLKIYSENKYKNDELSLYGYFVSCEIQNDFETNDYTKYKFKINYEDIEFYITIYSKKSINMKHLRKWATLCLLLKIIHKSKINVNIYLFLINKNKKLNRSQKLRSLGVNNINSAYAQTMGFYNSKVCIFREEEIEKVLLHEMIHALNLDNTHLSKETTISKSFNISPEQKIILNEAYTEIWAVIYLCFLKTLETKKSFKANIKIELEHTLKQISKILNYYGFTDISDFNKSYDGLNRFNQTTSVFSYFFVKGALLFQLEKFLSLDATENRHKITSDMLISFCKNKKYLEEINKYMKKKDSSRSLRMTIL